jgi:hypothetical protein
MSLNSIQFKTGMVADLYKNTLVETKTSSPSEPKQVKYLGNNQKNILVIVSHPNIPFLPDQELSFLSNILAACKLSIADIGIINNTGVNEADLQDIIQLEAKTVLLFGTEPLMIGLPINFPPFQLQQFNKRMYLHAPDLLQIEKDKGLKSKLWNSLKALFAI